VSTTALPRNLLIFLIILPLAVIVGYLLSTPDQFRTLSIVGILLTGLTIPIFLRWHHSLLICVWNANMIVFFLPGKPALWMLFACISLGVTILTYILDKQSEFQHVPSITASLLFLLFVVLLTAKATGGIGLRSLGGAVYGGRKMAYVIGAIVGYFALSARRVQPDRAPRLTAVYFLSALTGVAANVIYFAGPAFYFLYLVFPVDNAITQAMEDFSSSVVDPKLSRLPGAAAAGTALLYVLVMRYGIRGLLDLSKPWRVVLATALFGLSLLGGFRSSLLIVGLLFVIQFYFERLFRTRLVVGVLIACLLGGAVVTVFARHMPLSVQRSLSFLPIDVDPETRANAQGSLEWRLEMWRLLVREVPQYFWIGKGYAINPTDLYFAQESWRRGLAKDYEGAVVAGDYHSGPLSILIPFGIFGMIGFLWFIIVCIRVLYRQYLSSDEKLKNINTFLLSYFVARVIFYFVGFGAFNSDLWLFTGLIGLSIAVNGVPKPALSPAVVPQLQPSSAFT
jgi:O-antigen ligase